MMTTKFSTMQYLMSRRSSSKYYGLTRQMNKEVKATSKEDQEKINKIIEESKTSKLSSKQIDTLKSAVKQGLLGSSSNHLSPLGMYNYKKSITSSNSNLHSTLRAYRNSI
ncbi:hypothetical protein BFM98_19905 [Lysinibacillus sp. AR18-8]|nr:hypothetical protein BFM98_19905 [Lysinibacillus sp. AR18-8]